MKNKNLLIISCGNRKRKTKTQAQNLYNGLFFITKLKFAKSLKNIDKIMILSGKYGLINLDEEIEPYDQKLSKDFVFDDNSLKMLKEYNVFVLVDQKYHKIIKKQIDIKLSLMEIYNNHPLTSHYGCEIRKWLNINNGKDINDFFDNNKLNWNIKGEIYYGK